MALHDVVRHSTGKEDGAMIMVHGPKTKYLNQKR